MPDDIFQQQAPSIRVGYGPTSTPATGKSTYQDAVSNRIYLDNPSVRGKLCAVKMPAYEPITDLLWTEPPVDNPDTPDVDESTLMPKETWARKNRPFLVNFGGNRIAIINEPIMFDASTSQGDEDALPTTATWDYGDSGTGTGLIVSHTYTSTGTYSIVCTLNGQTSTRYVRVLNNLGESDWDITQLNSLSGSMDSDWQASFLVQTTTDNIDPFQGILLYIYDDTDISWRQNYEASFRKLARATAFTSQVAADPIWDVSTVDSGDQTATGSGDATTANSIAGLGDPTGGSWPTVNQWDSQIASNCATHNVPPNMAKAVVYLESGGDPNAMTATGNTTCPYAYGLFQIACGCAVVTCVSNDTAMLDPDTNIEAGVRHLSINYANCNNSWDGAICQFFSGHCVPNGASDILGTTDYDYVNIVKQHWSEADAAIPAVGGGTDNAIPQFGEVIFDGYVLNIETIDHKDGTDMTVNCVSSGTILNKLSMRREVFFESSQYGNFGGTIMGGPPMRIASCMHHMLKVHTDFPNKHDVILDWSGPRMTSTTANEGMMMDNFKQWAENDFATVWTDRHGRLRYEPKPWYRGKNWFDQAVQKAALIDPTLIFAADVTERTMDARTSWVKLCGLLSDGSCEICGTYPCGNPPTGNAGNWAVQRGYQYDDYKTLCAMAAYHYAYLNRRYDISFTIGWRHDLEIHDLIQMPIKDKSGKFDWSNGLAPVFVITSISHEFNLASASWITTVEASELTYGVACNCPEPHCPKTVECTTCGDGGTSGGDGSGTSGACTSTDPTNWTIWNSTHSEGTQTTSFDLVLSTDELTGYIGNEFGHLDGSIVLVSGPVWFNGGGGYICKQSSVNGSSDSSAINIITGTPNSLTSNLSYNYSIGDGDAVFTTNVGNETISYFDITVTGPSGYSKKGILTVTPISIIGSVDIVFTALNNNPSSTEPSNPLDRPISNVDITPLGSWNVIATIVGEQYGVPQELIPVQQIPIDLPTSPSGITYRIGCISSNPIVTHGQTEDYCKQYREDHYQTDPWPDIISTSPTPVWGWVDHSWASNGFCSYYNPTSRGIGTNEADFIDGSIAVGQHAPFGTDTSTQTLTTLYTTITSGTNMAATAQLNIQLNWSTCSTYTGSIQGSTSSGPYSYPTSGTSVNGTCTGWPSADAINSRIQKSEQTNNREGPLHSTGSYFIQYAQQYGINPGVVTAILQRESQLASDGSTLPMTFNNFGGVTGSGTCGTGFLVDRNWAKFCTPQDGLQAVFSTLNSSIYRDTGGKLADVMNIYSPPDENNVADMWAIFNAVASDLSITLEPDTQVFSTSTDCTTPAGQLIAGPPAGQPGYGGYTTMLEYVMHQQNMQIAQGPFGAYSHAICDCYDMAVPIGTPIYPLIAGTVTISEATDDVNGPNTIVIHTDSYGDFRYDHFSTRSVLVGQTVGLDTLIGYSGTAGTGAHLHLGLEGGVANSPKGLTLTQTMQAVGFGINLFPWES